MFYVILVLQFFFKRPSFALNQKLRPSTIVGVKKHHLPLRERSSISSPPDFRKETHRLEKLLGKGDDMLVSGSYTHLFLAI